MVQIIFVDAIGIRTNLTTDFFEMFLYQKKYEQNIASLTSAFLVLLLTKGMMNLNSST